ncbi:MAG: hypothetical protein CW716_02365 [Candidatus Bathyarchaeum sp.]|nr:MAG: hypothetical protein CW716_02365 [Candidatus Bathyarchaeum sp.]
MLFDKVQKAWKRRANRHLIQQAGKEDWCAFAKALCSSADKCQGFPYECKACFDKYYKSPERLKQFLEH